MPAAILYCGDTDLSSAAGYLAGMMTQFGWEFEYRPSEVPLTSRDEVSGRKLYIFSDYPAVNVSKELQIHIADQVAGGAGLLMIGGWESFHGFGGNWDGTPVGDLLGVSISARDDRCNSFSPAMLVPEGAADHPTVTNLPWRSSPAFVGGWNAVELTTAVPLLNIRQFQECRLADDGTLLGTSPRSFPGLTVNSHGAGRATAFLSDVAPHWVGGFVDWGDARFTAQAIGASAIEVGNWYACFWKQLLAWTGRLE